MIGNHYEIIVIPAGKAIAANRDADKEDSGKTSKTFTVGLSPTGKLPITHHWCCWWVSDEKAKKLRKDFDPNDPANMTNKHQSKIYDLSKGWTPEKILEDNGLKTIGLDLPTKTKPEDGSLGDILKKGGLVVPQEEVVIPQEEVVTPQEIEITIPQEEVAIPQKGILAKIWSKIKKIALIKVW